MTNETSNNTRLNGRLVFFREFLKHPLQIGSIIPSSRFLEQRLVEAAGVAKAKLIIELGPGVGGVTKAILHSLPQEATLLCVEINPIFHKLVNKIEDERLIAHLGSAGELQQIIDDYGLNLPDAIISGIPFSTMSRQLGSSIVESVATILPPQGRFVAYQVNDQVAQLSQPFFGESQTSMELFNIPPMRIFQWQKKS